MGRNDGVAIITSSAEQAAFCASVAFSLPSVLLVFLSVLQVKNFKDKFYLNAKNFETLYLFFVFFENTFVWNTKDNHWL